MFSSYTDVEKGSFLPSTSSMHPHSTKHTSPLFTLKDTSDTLSKPLKYLLLSLLTFTFLFTFWHTATPSQFSNATSSSYDVQTDLKLSQMFQKLHHSMQTQHTALITAQLSARYHEGVTFGLSQRQNFSSPQGQFEEPTQQQQYEHHQQQQAHHAEISRDTRTLRQILDDVKADVVQSTHSTIQTLSRALRVQHISTSVSDKFLTAQKLVEVAVAFEVAAQKLTEEAREVAGKDVVDKIERKVIKEQVEGDDEVNKEMVDGFFPVNEKLVKAIHEKRD